MFGHLENYSCYSFQESTLLIEPFVKRAKALKIDALALTDKNNMHGAVEFMKACNKYGIKAIYGLEASVIVDEEIYPFTLIAYNQDGYYALIKITSDIQLSDKHAITLESLKQYSDSIYVLSSGEDSLLHRLILKDLENEAVRYMTLFKQYFNHHFYICVQNHDIALQMNVNHKLVNMAKALEIKVVCSNKNAYLLPSDSLAVEYLKASKNQHILPYNHQVKTDQRYLKNENQMRELFNDQIMEETSKLIQSCQVEIPLNHLHMPKFAVKNNLSSALYLTELCKVGLRKRFEKKKIPVEYIKRLNYELSVINSMDFSDYFLIVWDYVRYAKVNGILVGPGRGSAAGSLVAYVLGITNVDPIYYNLIFERFLNPERISMPDIDIDFQDDRRDEVVNYLEEKYGHEHVAQIVTFNTYGPRVAIRDLGKVLSIPLVKLDMLAKMVPTAYKFKKTAKEVYETSAQFQNMVHKDHLLEKLMPTVFSVEALPKNISTHAAGVVLCGEPLDHIVPLAIGPSGTIMTQYSKDYIEEAGLLKMDILGLRNLTIISRVLEDIEHSTGEQIELSEIPLDDAKTYQMIAKGDTFGVFQLESSGMINLLRKIKVSEFEDIVAAVALYRPGPMQNIPTYLSRKHKKEPINYVHEDLKEILEPTYGIMIYQEQIMQIAQKMAGFSFGKADILRKAMSKKGSELMESMKEAFIDGSLAKGYTKDKAIEVFELIAKFANYGFNRSHSVAYAYVAYQIAYLKANYSLEFFASFLSNVQNSESHKLSCIQEAKKYNVSILPPSINYSINRFSVEGNHIRFSLTSVKNVGYAAYQEIVEEREKNGLYKDVFDFFIRMDTKRLSGLVIESLIDAGAFDEFDISRKMIKENLKDIENYASLNKSIGFNEKPILKIIKESKEEKLEKEHAVLGLYLSAHPVTLYRQRVKQLTISVHQYMQYINQTISSVLCLQRVRVIKDKKGNYMCFITAFDETGNVDGVVFSSQFSKLRPLLNRGDILLIEGRVDFKDKLSLVVQNVVKV